MHGILTPGSSSLNEFERLSVNQLSPTSGVIYMHRINLFGFYLDFYSADANPCGLFYAYS